MKRKAVQIVLSLTLTAAMCFGAPVMAFAGETRKKVRIRQKRRIPQKKKKKQKIFRSGILR